MAVVILVLTAVFCYFYFSRQFIDIDDNEVKKKSRDDSNAAINGYKTASDSPISPSEKFQIYASLEQQ